MDVGNPIEPGQSCGDIDSRPPICVRSLSGTTRYGDCTTADSGTGDAVPRAPTIVEPLGRKLNLRVEMGGRDSRQFLFFIQAV